MSIAPPMPVLDLSNERFVVAAAFAARQHVSPDVEGRPRTTYGPEHREWAALPERRCLYCGTPDPLGSEEHVLGVSLGNWWWVIPPDVVCHGCNHGPLAELDERLKNHPFIALIRTLTNIPGRKGQPPATKASNLTMHRTPDGDLQVETNHPRHATIDDDVLKAQVKWTNFGPSQRRSIARALMKVGLGVLWLARGPDETAQSRYDHVRDAVLQRASVPLKHGFGNSAFPNHALAVQVISDRLQPGLLVTLHYFGTEFWAQSVGYEWEASAEFIAEDVDHQYVDYSVDEPQPSAPTDA